MGHSCIPSVMSPSPTSDHDDMPYVYLLAHLKLLQKDALSSDSDQDKMGDCFSSGLRAWKWHRVDHGQGSNHELVISKQ